MIFTKLELENFKSHKKTSIDFNSGISLIIGENGAGKSTIFEAISFALYKKYTGDKIDDLVRTNKDIENVPMTVRLSFISGGNEYRVTRGRRSRKSIARLERQSRSSFDFTPIVEGDSQVNNRTFSKWMQISSSMRSMSDREKLQTSSARLLARESN